MRGVGEFPDQRTRGWALVATAASIVGPGRPMTLETIRAIDGAIVSRLERPLSVFSAVGAHGRKHLAGAAIVAAAESSARAVRSAAASVASGSAGWAPAGVILKTPAGEELLLPGGKHERLAAI